MTGAHYVTTSSSASTTAYGCDARLTTMVRPKRDEGARRREAEIDADADSGRRARDHRRVLDDGERLRDGERALAGGRAASMRHERNMMPSATRPMSSSGWREFLRVIRLSSRRGPPRARRGRQPRAPPCPERRSSDDVADDDPGQKRAGGEHDAGDERDEVRAHAGAEDAHAADSLMHRLLASLHSSYHAIWIASSFGSFDVFGSSSKSSSASTRSRRSVKRTVSGSTPGNFSTSAMPMSSASVHFTARPPALLRVLAIGLAELDAAAFLHVVPRVHRQLADDVARDDGLAAEARLRGEAPRRVEAIGFVVLHLAQVLRAFVDDDVARRAGAAPAARVLERNAEILGDVEERLGLAVMRVRQLAVLELDGLRFAVDDESDFGHVGISGQT